MTLRGRCPLAERCWIISIYLCLWNKANLVLLKPVSPERVDSPQLAVNLGSNNPFRNRALSPSISTRPLARPERPTSTNPFLDDADLAQSAPGASAMSQPVAQQDLTGNARDLFVRLHIRLMRLVFLTFFLGESLSQPSTTVERLPASPTTSGPSLPK